jgi:ELWxxDGT repeat protein
MTILAVLGDKLMLMVDDGQSGHELWSSDGTNLGTKPVFEIEGPMGLVPNRPTVVDPLMFFVHKSPDDHWVLWRTDGSNEGTFQLTNDSGSVALGNLVGMDERLYFTYDDGSHGYELWSTDGTVAGTALVQDIVVGPGTSEAWPLLAWDGMLFLRARDESHGTEPWILDTVTPGDANRDGAADLTDFGLLKANFGSGQLRSEGDFNRDGLVDLTDFGILKSRFGLVGPAAVGVRAALPGPYDSHHQAVDQALAVLALAMDDEDAEEQGFPLY